MKIDELNPWFFPLPSDMCAITPGSNHDFTRSVYRAVVSSPVVMLVNFFSIRSGNIVNRLQMICILLVVIYLLYYFILVSRLNNIVN